jgi:spore maturation protein CgeB
MNQISPRIFEAIGCGCCLILYSGQYSGILKPGVHFIELKKDFSNIEEVVHKVKDRDYVRFMAERAYKDVVSSGRYSYEIFVRGVEREIEALISKRGKRALSGQTGDGAYSCNKGSTEKKFLTYGPKSYFLKDCIGC